ncbi:MAG: hypothetical protein AMJ78_09665 [Omnitrophica WOR_2 bacterium SM23_29]|nr:MAG: hypothetical protein AMJ78_09665 [Omnitrophica WOR_2 bacterium SM23_29]
MNSRVSIVKCKNYNSTEVTNSINRAIELLGGMSKYVKKAETILLKPNLLSAKPPESGVDTHPEFVRSIAKVARQAGANVIVGDSPGGYGLKDAGSTYEASGIKKMCEEEAIKLEEFDRAYNVDGIPLAVQAKEVDGIISIPKMKTHNLTTITGAIKNSFGLAVGLYKTNCHLKAPRPKDFAKYLVDIFECAPPRMVIMDGIVAMEGEGPAAGDLRNAQLILASNDCVACDAVFSYLVGLPPLSIHTTSEAYRRKLGQADLSKIEILGERLEDVKLRNFKLPKTSILLKIPEPILKLLGKGIKFWPVIDEATCTKCRLCAESCPTNCITIDKEVSKIDYRKCISCFCCFEVCPYNSISVKRSLLAKALGG